jgi:hypothetical protein
MNKEHVVFQDTKINIKMLLSGLWIVLMFIYIYADILSLYRPGQINKMIDGFMGPFVASQGMLVVAALLMSISIFMVFVCLILPASINRWINIVVGFLLALVGIANLLGDSWIFYWIYGIMEIIITLSIAILAIRWPKVEKE